ncbi:MAG: biosynthetic arginine decarboxylase [Gammaproteobacteria bacterium]
MTWTIDKARRRYNIATWSSGYFDVNAQGHVVARPQCIPGSSEINLYELADRLHDAGLTWPVLVRFTDILRHRVDRLCAAFEQARAEHGYGGAYTAVYPVKVNQQRHVVDAIVEHGGLCVGLEAGSKPEMMVVLAVAPANGVIICNGYKDAEYIELALMGQRLGQRITLVIEKLSELELVLQVAARLNMRPRLGLRIRLSAATSGNWQNTGGDRSKFGLTASGVLALLERLRAAGMSDCLHLLHCHPGSQIASMSDFRRALEETARYYVQLHALGVSVDTVDVGGGLGVDYDGTASKSDNSVNYSLDEYAAAVVGVLTRVCDERGLPHPDLVTESGRAMTAHHAVLITNVIDTEQVLCTPGVEAPSSGEAAPVTALRGDLGRCGPENALAVYDDANVRLADLRTLYISGGIELAQRALGESLYYAVCRVVQGHLAADPNAHAVLDEITRKLADKYFCNLSVFQSMPDVWGIDQIFPIMPLHRLNEEPLRRATLQDLTCDSDGHIEYYVDGEGVESSLPLHALRADESYLLGIFLIGAYQEILGDMHNLFGDTDAVNVELTAAGGYRLVEPRHGDTVEELLRYVEFDPAQLLARYRDKIVAAGLDAEEQAAYQQFLQSGLEGYTYLEEP